MLKRPLGRSGLDVSVVGIGTAQLRQVPEQQALDTLRAAFDLGVNIVHTAPDYEGAEDLVAEAVRASGREVYVASQGYGSVEHFQNLFEATCAKLGRESLEIFGVACVDDRERLGEDVWGPAGMNAVLARMKREGRLQATFCTTHGSPEYVRKLIESGAFDAIMLAYNPLGFHMLSHNLGGEPGEVLPETPSLFPFAASRGVGLMVMKPLAGGMLTRPVAFPMHDPTLTPGERPAAADVLRYILAAHPEVSCVVPGTASAAEARENALAGHGSLELTPRVEAPIRDAVRTLQASICSRCGRCDDLCSRNLRVSWLFRAAYIDNHRSMPYETPAQLQYFDLHPAEPKATCDSCTDVTCACPYGIDIPASLSKTHGMMIKLRERGAIGPSPPAAAPTKSHDAHLVAHDIDAARRADHVPCCRLSIRNAGTNGWHPRPPHPRAFLVVRHAGREVVRVPVRGDVSPGQQCQLTFDLARAVKPDAKPWWSRWRSAEAVDAATVAVDCEMVFEDSGGGIVHRAALGRVVLPLPATAPA